jgi:hypothetical protein
MPTFQTYNVTPILPATLEPLRELSFNLWWTWEPAARRLFRELDPELWNQTNHNPVRMLQLSRQSRLEELAQDKNFLRELKQVFQDFEKYLGRRDTYGKTGAGAAIKNPIAIFPPNSVFTNRSRITPAVWESSPATTANPRATSISISLRLVSSIGTAISGNRSTKTAFRQRLISTKIFITCRSVRFAGAKRNF